jgi:hypothetical protein
VNDLIILEFVELKAIEDIEEIKLKKIDKKLKEYWF